MSSAQLAAVSYLARYSGHTHSLYACQLRQWFAWCETNALDPLVGIQRAHVELYIRQLGDQGLMDYLTAGRMPSVRLRFGMRMPNTPSVSNTGLSGSVSAHGNRLVSERPVDLRSPGVTEPLVDPGEGARAAELFLAPSRAIDRLRRWVARREDLDVGPKVLAHPVSRDSPQHRGDGALLGLYRD